MDHLGIRSRPGSDTTARDSIYNGADDNASGTTGVLELAEAFAAAGVRPRRSLLFLLVSGEEQGLWGSDYFATRPPVPLEQMVADINMDMIGRNSPDTIAVIGIDQSDLGTTLHAIADDHAELGMAVVDDPWPQLRLYTRSDHFNFARRGVPVLFFFNGTHEDYHRPGDEPQKINAEKEARILKLIYLLGARVANADQRPQWNKESYEAVVGSSRP
jgi:Zn-dependent M28 family amino/carboxypeptidase